MLIKTKHVWGWITNLCGIKDTPVLKGKDAKSLSMKVRVWSIVKSAFVPLASVQLQQFSALDLYFEI